MDQPFAPRTTSRARWLAELSAALDDAQILLSRLVAERIDQADADLLREQIDEIRTELRVLHRRGFAADQDVKAPRLVHPDWRPRRA
jgi:hypothetical protein